MLRQVSAAASYMDSKRRGGGGGFIKGKLRSLYRPSGNKVKPSISRGPSPAATNQRGRMKMMMNKQKSNMNVIATATRCYNKVPSTTTTSTAASSVGTVNVNQDLLPKHITATTGGVDSYNAAVYGGLQVDESVDLKAANYISSVLERLRTT